MKRFLADVKIKMGMSGEEEKEVHKRLQEAIKRGIFSQPDLFPGIINIDIEVSELGF